MLHERARREWYGASEKLDAEELIAEKYRGIRPAFGYPACPDHREKRKLFELLDAETSASPDRVLRDDARVERERHLPRPPASRATSTSVARARSGRGLRQASRRDDRRVREVARAEPELVDGRLNDGDGELARDGLGELKTLQRVRHARRVRRAETGVAHDRHAAHTSPEAATATATTSFPFSVGSLCTARFAHARSAPRCAATTRSSPDSPPATLTAASARGPRTLTTAPHDARPPHDAPECPMTPSPGGTVGLVEPATSGALADADATTGGATSAGATLVALAVAAVSREAVGDARHAASLTPSAAATAASHASRERTIKTRSPCSRRTPNRAGEVARAERRGPCP